MNWSAAILAGGRARRLGGQDKSALIVDGLRFIDRQREALAAADRSHRARRLSRRRSPASLPVEHDRWPDAGPLGGLATALLTATTDRVLVLACDLPCVTTQFLAFLADVDPDATAVVPVVRWPLAAAVRDLCAARRRDVRDRPRTRRSRRGARSSVSFVRALIGHDEWAPFDRDRAPARQRQHARRSRAHPLARVARGDRGALTAWNAADRTAGSEASQTTTR